MAVPWISLLCKASSKLFPSEAQACVRLLMAKVHQWMLLHTHLYQLARWTACPHLRVQASCQAGFRLHPMPHGKAHPRALQTSSHRRNANLVSATSTRVTPKQKQLFRVDLLSCPPCMQLRVSMCIFEQYLQLHEYLCLSLDCQLSYITLQMKVTQLRLNHHSLLRPPFGKPTLLQLLCTESTLHKQKNWSRAQHKQQFPCKDLVPFVTPVQQPVLLQARTSSLDHSFTAMLYP